MNWRPTFCKRKVEDDLFGPGSDSTDESDRGERSSGTATDTPGFKPVVMPLPNEYSDDGRWERIGDQWIQIRELTERLPGWMPMHWFKHSARERRLLSEAFYKKHPGHKKDKAMQLYYVMFKSLTVGRLLR